MKRTNELGLLSLGFTLVIAMASPALGRAEEYYTYKDANGNLVISNKKPPIGSKILKSQELPAPAEVEPSKSGPAPAKPTAEKSLEKAKQ